MELVGDEKRIPALFSDLKFQDQAIAPSFDRLWKAAQTTKPQRLLLVEPMLVLGSLAIIAALVMWFKDTSTQPPIQPSVAIVLPAESRVEAPKKLSVNDRRRVQRRKVRPKEPEHALIEQAAGLSSWQSPTGSLMGFTADTVVKSLPDLTESVTDLESYLSNNGVKELKK